MLTRRPAVVGGSVLCHCSRFLRFVGRNSAGKGGSGGGVGDLRPSFARRAPRRVLSSACGRLRSGLSRRVLRGMLRRSPRFFRELIMSLLMGVKCKTNGVAKEAKSNKVSKVVSRSGLKLSIVRVRTGE